MVDFRGAEGRIGLRWAFGVNCRIVAGRNPTVRAYHALGGEVIRVIESELERVHVLLGVHFDVAVFREIEAQRFFIRLH